MKNKDIRWIIVKDKENRIMCWSSWDLIASSDENKLLNKTCL